MRRRDEGAENLNVRAGVALHHLHAVDVLHHVEFAADVDRVVRRQQRRIAGRADLGGLEVGAGDLDVGTHPSARLDHVAGVARHVGNVADVVDLRDACVEEVQQLPLHVHRAVAVVVRASPTAREVDMGVDQAGQHSQPVALDDLRVCRNLKEPDLPIAWILPSATKTS